MIKSEILVTFSHVARLGSFTAAAGLIGITTMAVSKQIAQLENELSEPLFERTTRKVNLTQFGVEFLEQAHKVLAQNELMENWLESREGKVTGTLRVVTQLPEVYQQSVIPWISEFCELYPHLQMEFDVRENIIDIENDQYDIYWGVSEYLGKNHSGLKRRSLWRSQYGIYASPKYIEIYGNPRTLKELKQHKLISYLHNKPNNILLLKKDGSDKATASTSSEPDYIELDCNLKTVTGLLELAVQGLGIINYAADERELKRLVDENKLIPLMQNFWWPSAEIYLYYQQVKMEQPKVRAFIDFFIGKGKEWL